MSAMGQSNFQVNVIVNINTSDWAGHKEELCLCAYYN
jgi:hypothetical protein